MSDDNLRFYVGDIDDLDGLTRSEVEDLTVEYYRQAEDRVEEYLNEAYDMVKVGYSTLEVGRILRACEPLSFDATVLDRTVSVDLTDYPEDED